MHNKLWMIRAGRNAALIQDFEEKEYVAVGWIKMRDLTNIKTKKELEKVFKEAYPDEKKAKSRMQFGQISRFRFDIHKGDWVTTYNPEFRTYPIGEIISDYQYIENSAGNFNHIYKVKWLGKVSRDLLSVTTKNTVGAIMTLFLLNDSATEEFKRLLSGEKPSPKDDENTEDAVMEDIREDIKGKAFEFIKDNILKLDWEEMQELTAGILRAMGYKTRVTPPGADRGKDIVASPDGLGLEQPRIKVEVKHREGGPIGASTLRSFIGGLTQSDRGLYVSTGGFTRESRYEAERSSIPVTLIDIDELADLLIRNYDNTDSETKALIPLVKVYWPAN